MKYKIIMVLSIILNIILFNQYASHRMLSSEVNETLRSNSNRVAFEIRGLVLMNEKSPINWDDYESRKIALSRINEMINICRATANIVHIKPKSLSDVRYNLAVLGGSDLGDISLIYGNNSKPMEKDDKEYISKFITEISKTKFNPVNKQDDIESFNKSLNKLLVGMRLRLVD